MNFIIHSRNITEEKDCPLFSFYVCITKCFNNTDECDYIINLLSLSSHCLSKTYSVFSPGRDSPCPRNIQSFANK